MPREIRKTDEGFRHFLLTDDGRVIARSEPFELKREAAEHDALAEAADVAVTSDERVKDTKARPQA